MEDQIKVTLIERIERSKDIESFRFEPEKRVDFLAGQFTQLIFDPQNLNNRELNKYLSFSSSPTQDYLEVTKRLTESKFSQKLKSLAVGDKLIIKSAIGSCVFNESYKNIAFLVGGIGITPVISIVQYLVDKNLDTDVVLLYSNRTEDIAFRRQLDSWQDSYNKLKVIYTITGCQPRDEQCLSGAIDEKLIKEKIQGWRERIIFIFGPPLMVEAMKNLCLKVGCDRSTIKIEKFIGY